MDRKRLEEEKANLVGMYCKVKQEIDSYGLKDLAISSGPLKEMLNRKERIEYKINLINKQLEGQIEN